MLYAFLLSFLRFLLSPILSTDSFAARFFGKNVIVYINVSVLVKLLRVTRESILLYLLVVGFLFFLSDGLCLI